MKPNRTQKPDPTKKEMVDHPDHYGGCEDPYEAVKVIQAWGLSFCLGSVLKYVKRHGKKDPRKTIEDLEKAKKYIDLEIRELRAKAHAIENGPRPGISGAV